MKDIMMTKVNDMRDRYIKIEKLNIAFIQASDVVYGNNSIDQISNAWNQVQMLTVLMVNEYLEIRKVREELMDMVNKYSFLIPTEDLIIVKDALAETLPIAEKSMKILGEYIEKINA